MDLGSDCIARNSNLAKNIERKLQLIICSQSTWRDLSEDWGKPLQRYQWPDGQSPETAKD